MQPLHLVLVVLSGACFAFDAAFFSPAAPTRVSCVGAAIYVIATLV